MAAYSRVYDSRHLHADCLETGISSGTLRWVIEYGLYLFYRCAQLSYATQHAADVTIFTRNPQTSVTARRLSTAAEGKIIDIFRRNLSMRRWIFTISGRNA